MKKLCTCLALLIGLQGLSQICNSLDNTFGVGGLATNYKPATNEYIGSVRALVQPDDKIIGTANLSLGTRMAVIVQRFQSNGAVDKGFGIDGIGYIFPSNQESLYGYDMALQPDGKILVAGTMYDQGRRLGFLARMDITGKRDSSFGSNGVILSGTGVQPEYFLSVNVQPGGKILVSGIRYLDTSLCDIASYNYPVLFVRRYNSDGTSDIGFGQNGFIYIQTGKYSDSYVRTLLRPDGSFLLGVSAGYDCACVLDDYYGYKYWVCAKSYLLMQRFSPDGILDPGFGNAGKVADSSWVKESNDMALQPDGSIIVSGVRNYTEVITKRYLANGSPDPGYGVAGTAVLDLSNWELAQYVENVSTVGLADGKILLAGNLANNTGNRRKPFLARLTSTGRLDSTFYVTGKTTLPLGADNESAALNTVFLQGNGILVDGFISRPSKPGDLFIAKMPLAAKTFTVDVKPSGPLSVCLADSVGLSTEVQGLYQWYVSGTAITGAFLPIFVPKASGTYQVRVINQDGCGISPPVSVTMLLQPGAPYIAWNGTQFTADQGYVRYQWYLDNAPISGATSYQYTPGNALGAFRLQVWNTEGCSNFSAPYNLVITGIADIRIGDAKMRVFPNPARSELFIDLSQPTLTRVTAELYDLSGRLMEKRNLQNGRNEIPLYRYRAGLYAILIRSGNDRVVRKLIITQ